MSDTTLSNAPTLDDIFNDDLFIEMMEKSDKDIANNNAGGLEVKTCNSMQDIFDDLDAIDLLNQDNSFETSSSIMMTEERNQSIYGGHYNLSGRNSYNKGDSEITATHTPCKNFDDYQKLIDDAQIKMQQKGFKKGTISEKQIKTGDVFVSQGLVNIVVAINDSEYRNSGQNKRAHVVYANGTESHLLLSSIVANTYKDNSYYVVFDK